MVLISPNCSSVRAAEDSQTLACDDDSEALVIDVLQMII
jgi:hypothetical protein